MLPCFIIPACLLAVAAAVDSSASLRTATNATSPAASTSSSSSVAGTCLGYECRQRAAPRQSFVDDDDNDNLRQARTFGAPGARKLVRTSNQDLDGDDPVHDKHVLHESAARMTEDLRKDEEDDEEQDEDGASQPAEQGRAAKKNRLRQSGKIGKRVDGAVLQMVMMLKMMPLMFISTKVAVLSFLVQLKSLGLSLVSVAIAAVQFFWRFQEKRQRTSAALTAVPTAAAAAGWEDHGVWPDRRKYISF